MPLITKSINFQERAIHIIPGMTQLLSKRPDMFSLGVWPAYFSRAKGSHVWDLDGNEYVDMSISAIGAAVLGYADPDVDAAVCAAVSAGVVSSLNCPEEVELAELLCELHPWAEMVRYARTGGEAMAMAVRIARAATGRDEVAFCGYHGWHDWYLAANVGTENALGEHLLSGLSPRGVAQGLAGTAHPFGYNRLEELKRIAADRGKHLAAIIMEPIRDHEPVPGFIEGVKAVAERLGAVFIVDEISAGLRLCTGGAHLKIFSVRPDMAVFSKALGNGYAIAAVIGRRAVMEAAQTTFISSTNWTERIGPAAALATIRKHRAQNVAEHLIALGHSVQQGWKKAAERNGLSIHIEGMKPMSHFSFAGPDGLAMKAFFIQEMLDEGYLASNLYYAMHAHTDEDVAGYLTAVDRVFAKLAAIPGGADLHARLKGKPAVSGFKRLT